MALKAVIFDLAGTLVDYPVDLTQVLTTILNIAPKLVLSEEFIHDWSDTYISTLKRNNPEFKETTFLNTLKEVSDRRDLRLSRWEMMKIIGILYREVNVTSAKLITGAREILEYAKSLRQLKVAIISNTAWPGRLHEEDLRRFGIFEYIDLFVWSSDYEIKKPNPRIFSETLDLLKVKASEAIFFGDTYHKDVVGANNVGMPAVFLSEDAPPLDFNGDQAKNLSEAKYILSNRP